MFDIRALWRSGLSARAPECQKSKLVGYTSMALNASDSNNLEQLRALKGLIGANQACGVPCYIDLLLWMLPSDDITTSCVTRELWS